MANKVLFGWALHQHQPIGNFPWVFSQVYEICYAPLIDAFERHPGVHVTLHYSGPLLDWLLAEHPDYIARIARLAQRGQVEMMTGGYYEPILSIIPEYDRYGQIMKMNAAVRQHFGTDPQGLWLAERVWEPDLPSVLVRAGVGYTILDDTHFLMAGLSPNKLYGTYITEDQGNPLLLFPNLKLAREAIPFRAVPEVEAMFRKVLEQAQTTSTFDAPPPLVIMGDDGEKFGSWPQTFDPIWRKGYMEQLLTMFEENTDWLQTVTLREYTQQYAPQGRVYVPTASYMEMMEWSLPPQRQHTFATVRHELEEGQRTDTLAFLTGGIWRNFATKYPEANNMHKKMLRVHGKIRTAATILGPQKTQEAQNQLWQGQCNCAYWHGLFGGLYLADIRSAVYQHLIRAEAIADRALPTTELADTVVDFDCDGRDEVLIEGMQMDVYLDPHDGGTIFEWDWKAVPYNVIDTLARRPEAYHASLIAGEVRIVPPRDPLAEERAEEEPTSIHYLMQAKEAGLEKLLSYDAQRRSMPREHFFADDTTLADFSTLSYCEYGDFADGAFEHRIESAGREALVVDLWRDGLLRHGEEEIALRVRKVITVASGAAALQINYTLYNTSAVPVRMRFGVESNWGMLGGGHNPSAWYLINEARPEAGAALDLPGSASEVSSVALVNTAVGVQVTLLPAIPADLWRFPVETVANSEAGFERSYQCSCVVLHWPITITPGDRWSVSLQLRLATP